MKNSSFWYHYYGYDLLSNDQNGFNENLVYFLLNFSKYSNMFGWKEKITNSTNEEEVKFFSMYRWVERNFLIKSATRKPAEYP